MRKWFAVELGPGVKAEDRGSSDHGTRTDTPPQPGVCPLVAVQNLVQ